MEWVIMSERELNRIEVLAQVDDGRLTVANAAVMLDMTGRQLYRLLRRYREDGPAAIRHRARGRAPNNQIHKAKRDYALILVKEHYADFGPTLAAEKLGEDHGFRAASEKPESGISLRRCLWFTIFGGGSWANRYRWIFVVGSWLVSRRACVEAGQSRRAAAAKFDVSPSCGIELMRRYRETGALEPARQGRPPGGRLAPLQS